ncbi:helix-turn-helix domain-containing protein [Cetobacterium somerae]|uniref:helix-turn-helix domain-containing protein n=1 Tax=Cetobacterium sp. NK01 TaxID=2993530 RepID=UPI0021161771|nr:helix-turn-helix domain-containing protein [Cetobacterium sp. NK01]MCQ8212187.1 helix-turn-helix domain-containing protein [Cetobacterium sp. NK01]
MFLNKKSLHILSLFFSLNKFSYSDLEKILHIKKRSIDNNINIINDFLTINKIQGIQKIKDFFFLNSCSINKIKDILQFAPLSVTERKDYLLLQLFFENTLNLNINTDIVQTTRRTLNYDLRDIKSYLESEGIKIESISGRGIFLRGNEAKIRELFAIYLSKYLINKNINHKHFTDLISKYIHEDLIEYNKNFVLRLLNSISVTLVPEDFYKIVAILLVNSTRENKIDFEEEYFSPKKVTYHENYEKTLKFLKMRGLDYLKSYELDSVIETLFYLDIKRYEVPDDYTKIFMEKIKENFNIDFNNNLETKMRVSNVLRVGYFKSKYNFYENKEVYSFNKLQKETFKALKEIIHSIFPKFYLEDILHLAIILKKHQNNNILDRDKYKRVAIVDDTFDHMYAKLLLKYLKNFSYIEVVEIIESYEINSLLEDVFQVDYILTIDDLQNFKLNIPLIKINRACFLDDSFELSQLSLIIK